MCKKELVKRSSHKQQFLFPYITGKNNKITFISRAFSKNATPGCHENY